MNDDDLPVLTQVLRTGSGRREASIPPPVESPDDALDVRPVEETWMAERLAIGNEPARRVDDYPTQPSDRVVGPHVMHDASGLHEADSLQPPQEHDARHAVEAEGGTFGASHMYEAAGSRALDPRVTPIPPEDLASLALRVRDAVLDDLRTRIDTELDARIAQVMHAEVETALAQLQVNLRTHLTEALRDVVQRAVDEEVARLTAPARPGDAR
ncbi:MAG: hypothetical protein ABI277_07400 [Burkholderiaceae bacterium]